MRKILPEYENPIDCFLLDVCDQLLPTFHSLHFTPNMLTFCGLLCRLWAIWALFTKHTVFFLIGGFLGYLFDCLDGHYARTYNMTSKVGDLFDHASDILFNVVVLGYIFTSKNKYKWPILAGLGVLLILTFVHLGCQQRLYNKSGESLDNLKCFCPDDDWIHWTKYFGSGTFTTVTLMTVAGMLEQE